MCSTLALCVCVLLRIKYDIYVKISFQVVAEIQGDLMGSQGVGDFSYKYLLIPSILRWSNETLPVQYTVSKHACAYIRSYIM